MLIACHADRLLAGCGLFIVVARIAAQPCQDRACPPTGLIETPWQSRKPASELCHSGRRRGVGRVNCHPHLRTWPAVTTCCGVHFGQTAMLAPRSLRWQRTRSERISESRYLNKTLVLINSDGGVYQARIFSLTYTGWTRT